MSRGGWLVKHDLLMAENLKLRDMVRRLLAEIPIICGTSTCQDAGHVAYKELIREAEALLSEEKS